MKYAILPLTALALTSMSACSDPLQERFRAMPDPMVMENGLEFAARNANDATVIYWAAHVRTQAFYVGVAPREPGADTPPANATLRIASNTKTFVAVAVLKLVEQDRLELDTSLQSVVPENLTSLLEAGGYDTSQITVRMLLQHTSGLPDHAQLDVYFQQIMADTSRVWTRQEQVALAMSDGARVADPGERFAYSDTGYVLLGAILESVTGQSLAAAVRTLVDFDALELNATWWEDLEPAPANAPERFDQQAFGMALSDIDPSVDLYGGGGLVSNLQDLGRFHLMAASGQLFDDPALNAALIKPSPQSLTDGQGGYGMGFFIRTYSGETCYEHSGFWGTLAVYCPDSSLIFAAAVSDAEAGFATLRPFADLAVRAAD